MSSANQSIILVSGAFHTKFHTQPCLELLTRAGYHVIPNPLLMVGLKDPRPTFADEVENITLKIATEIRSGKDVSLICHSAGGIPTCEAINQFLSSATNDEKRKLVRLIFLASFIDARRTRQSSLKLGWLTVDAESMVGYCHNPGENFYNDMPESQRAPFVDALKPIVTWKGELTGQDWRTIPKTYMLCLQDKALPVQIQEQEAMENDFEVVKIDAGHCPFISQPGRFVALVDEILRA